MSALSKKIYVPTDKQKQAADPAHSVWVSANAGSGKTQVLVQRVIRILLEGIEPASILCITYTKAAAAEIAMIKVQAPMMALRILDDAIQAHGAGGVSEDFGLASAWAHQRTLRIADGPDEVHNRAIARIEFARHSANAPKSDAFSSGDVGVSR